MEFQWPGNRIKLEEVLFITRFVGIGKDVDNKKTLYYYRKVMTNIPGWKYWSCGVGYLQ